MMDRTRIWKRGSRALALLLAGAMVVSLGADLGASTQNVYAAEMQNDGSGDGNTVTYSCGKEEHKHSIENGCYQLTCGKDETEGRSHTLDCYEGVEPTCGIEESDPVEPHHHVLDCYGNKVLTCEIEDEDHEHTAECYNLGDPTCEQEETDGSEGHTHTLDCYKDAEAICGEQETETHKHTEDCYDLSKTICGKEEHEHTDLCLVEASSAAKPSNSNFDDVDDDDGGIALQSADDAVNMNGTDIVKGITGTGTTYDADKNVYNTDLSLEFEFATATVESTGYSYYYTYPDGVIIPDSLLNSSINLYDKSDRKAGTCSYERLSDGTYRININLDSDYVDKAGDTIPGYAGFKGQLGGDKGDKDGNIKISGSDGVEINIPANEITYPDDGKTNYYDIASSKSGSYSRENGKITYTVYVTSIKGTPDVINYTDTVTATGMNLTNPSVTVTKETIYREYRNNTDYWTTTSIWDNVDNPQSSEIITPGNLATADGMISMTLPQITRPEEQVNSSGTKYIEYTRYKVVYTYDATNMTSESPVAHNEVSVNSKNDVVEVKSKSEYDVRISNKQTMSKAGWYDAGNKEILWTIKINTDKVDIAGATLTDQMMASIVEGKDISISPDSGYEITRENGKITKITFVAGEDGTNRNEYEIKYRTAVNPSFDSQTITNEATFKPTSGDSIDATGLVDVSGGDVDKTGTKGDVSSDGKTMTVNWTITTTVPASGLPADTVIMDDPTGGNGDQYMTRRQVIDWANNIIWTNDNGDKVGDTSLYEKSGIEITFKASDEKEYTYAQINGNSNGEFDKLTYTVYTITLTNGLSVPDGATKMVFKYQTTADIENAEIGTTTFKNTVKINDKEKSSEIYYKKAGLIKTDGNNNTDKTQIADGSNTVKWKIKATLAESGDELVVTDTLPDGVKLSSMTTETFASMAISIANDGTISGDSGYYKVTGSYKDHTVEIHLAMTDAQAQAGQKLSAQQYIFVLTCDIDKNSLQDYAVGKIYPFKNNATATVDGSKIGDASQEQEWTVPDETPSETKVVDKSGSWDNSERRVKYSIALNPDGIDVLKGSDILTLIDTFQYYSVLWAAPAEGGDSATYGLKANLVPETVKVYKATKGEDGELVKGDAITNCTWTVEKTEGVKNDWEPGRWNTSTLTIKNLPDESPMIVEYEYKITSDVPANYVSTENLRIKNEAVLQGTDYKDGKTQTDTKWDQVEHEEGIETRLSYNLYKVEKDNFGKALAGVQFSLKKYTGGGWTDTGITYTSDNYGEIQIYWQEKDTDPQYEKDVVYKVVESKALDGYEPLDEDYGVAFFYFHSGDTEFSLPEAIATEAGDAVNLEERSDTEYIENTPEKTQIVVNKKWLNYDGSKDNGKTGSITVDIYQKSSTSEPTQSGPGTLSGEIRVGVNGNYSSVWKTYKKESHPAGSVVSLTLVTRNPSTVPAVYANGNQLQAMKATPGYDENGYVSSMTYEYSFTTIVGSNTLYGYVGWDEGVYEEPVLTVTEPVTTTGTKYGSVTVTSDEGWSKTVTNLPLKGKNDAGETVYYSYYVEESSVSADGYDVSIDNNGGITSGTITITNKSRQTYELPETGGSGALPWQLGGTAAILFSMFSGAVMMRRRHI